MEYYPLLRADSWEMPVRCTPTVCSDYIDVDTPRKVVPAGTQQENGNPFAMASPFSYRQASIVSQVPQSCSVDVAPQPQPSTRQRAVPPAHLRGSPLKSVPAQLLQRGSTSGPRLRKLPIVPSASSDDMLAHFTMSGLAPVRTSAPAVSPLQTSLLQNQQQALPVTKAAVPAPVTTAATCSATTATTAAKPAGVATKGVVIAAATAAAECGSPFTDLLSRNDAVFSCSPFAGMVTPRWNAFEGFDFACPDADNWRPVIPDEPVSTNSSTLSDQLALQTRAVPACATESAVSSPTYDACHVGSAQGTAAWLQQMAEAAHEPVAVMAPLDSADSLNVPHRSRRTSASHQRPASRRRDNSDSEEWEHDERVGTSSDDVRSDDGDAAGGRTDEDDEEFVGGDEDDLEYDPDLLDDAVIGLKSVKGRKRVRGVGGCARSSSKQGACLNCGTTNTPQWRCGPEGKRTLCNACGMRYRKGLPIPYWEHKQQQQARKDDDGE